MFRKRSKYWVPKKLATTENTERRLLYVAATPASGSSALARVMHEIGINMGWVGYVNPNRGYATYEDRHSAEFREELPGAADRLLRLRSPMFREYITWRFRNSHGPVGAKLSPFYPLHVAEPSTLPIEIVVLTRPLEDSIEADTLVNETIGTRIDGAVKMDLGNHMARASALGAAFMAKLILRRIFPVAAEVDFYAMADDPEGTVDRLILDLGLNSSRQQRDAAIKAIDPTMIHVRKGVAA